MNNEKMEDSKNLLSIDNLVSASDIPSRFKEIAEDLMNNYCIMKGNIRYEFVELEFYLYSQAHPDIITYPRSARGGDWFFHQSGVDICFGPIDSVDFQRKSYEEIVPVKEDDCFGGILIRCMKKMVKNNGKYEFVKYITGPLNCCYELFDQFSAFKSENDKFEYPYISSLENKNIKLYDSNISKDENYIGTCSRWFNFSNDEGKYDEIIGRFQEKQRITLGEFDEYNKANYRFFIKDDIVEACIEKPYPAKPFVGYEHKPKIKK